MDKLIELLKQAEARIKSMREDYELIALKTKEIFALLDRHLNDNVPTGPDLSKLSEREKEVFALIGQKVKTSMIAKKLNLSVKTVLAHRDNIRAKLNIENAYELRSLAEQIYSK